MSEATPAAVVLGRTLTHARYIDEVSAQITLADFTDPRHKTVYSAVTALAMSGGIGPIAVGQALGPDLDRIGGVPYLVELVEAGQDPGTTGYHVNQILAETRRRVVGEAGHALLQAADGHDEQARERRVQDILDHLDKRLHNADAAPFEMVRLDDFLAAETEPPRWRVDGLWPERGNVVLSAAYKAGKTTMIGNILRALADGGRFLGIYPTAPVEDGSIVLCDLEMPEPTLRDWLTRQGIERQDRIILASLRGQTSTFNLTDPAVRRHWVTSLRRAQCKVWVVDCLAPILNAIGADENVNSQVGPVLDGLAAVALAAGVSEICLVHHMGHNGERSRGASRLRDWPDAEWRLVRKRDEADPYGDPQPDAARFFSAFGRDVDVKEGQLLFDPDTKWLRYAAGSRRETAARTALAAVLAAVREKPGSSGRTVEDLAMRDGSTRERVREALKSAVSERYVSTLPGERRSTLYQLTPTGYARLAELEI